MASESKITRTSRNVFDSTTIGSSVRKCAKRTGSVRCSKCTISQPSSSMASSNSMPLQADVTATRFPPMKMIACSKPQSTPEIRSIPTVRTVQRRLSGKLSSR